VRIKTPKFLTFGRPEKKTDKNWQKIVRIKIAEVGQILPQAYEGAFRGPDLLAFLDALVADICSTSDPMMRVN
jgi:hypothetical protein